MSALLRILAAVVGVLPWCSLRMFGAALGWIAGTGLRIRRRHVEQAMRVAGIADVGVQAKAMYRSLGTSAFEFLYLAANGIRATAHAYIDPASRAIWREALDRRSGIVVAASHTGNWDLAACAVARELELLVVTKRLRVPALDAFWQDTRAAQGIRLANAAGAVARARSVLGRGGAVAMMIDQVPGDHAPRPCC